jgi:AcrR family transcriptional regulator
MAQTKTRDTKERILDAAEALFAEQGFAATSMRTITSEAGVNLAAANYHFGSKEMLIQAVLARRLVPINRERIERLDELESVAAAGPTAAQIVEAFIGPPLRMGRDAERGGPVFCRLLGHAMSQPKDQIRALLAEQFREVMQRFVEAVKRIRSDLPEREIPWRLLFIAGAMAHTMAMADEVQRLHGAGDPSSDAEEMIARLVPFLAAGLNSPAPADVEPGMT